MKTTTIKRINSDTLGEIAIESTGLTHLVVRDGKTISDAQRTENDKLFAWIDGYKVTMLLDAAAIAYLDAAEATSRERRASAKRHNDTYNEGGYGYRPAEYR